MCTFLMTLTLLMMETDGTYSEELSWTYKDVPPEGLQEDLYYYNGPGPDLC